MTRRRDGDGLAASRQDNRCCLRGGYPESVRLSTVNFGDLVA